MKFYILHKHSIKYLVIFYAILLSSAIALYAQEQSTQSTSTPNEERNAENSSAKEKSIIEDNQAVSDIFSVNQIFKNGAMGVDGLQGGVNITISPDGKDIYVAGNRDDAMAVFAYDETTNEYTFSYAVTDGKMRNTLGGIWDIAVSQDGNDVYITSYADDSISHFRKSSAGVLIFAQLFESGINEIANFNGPREILLTTDDAFVYVSNEESNSITVFARNTSTGALTSIGSVDEGRGASGLKGARGIAFNKDESVLYVAGTRGNSLVKLMRNSTTGQLQFHSSLKNGENGIVGLRGASTVFVDKNENIFVASFGDNALAVFVDNGDAMEQKSVVKHGDFQIKYFRQPYKVIGNKESDSVFVTSYKDNSVSEFAYITKELAMDDKAKNTEGLTAGTDDKEKNINDTLTLAQVSLFREDIGGVSGLNGAWGGAAHPNGDILVSGFKSNAIAIFRPESETGRMGYSHTIYDGDGKIQGLNRAFDIAVSNDNANIYVSGVFDSSIAIFSKNTAGEFVFSTHITEGVKATKTLNELGNELPITENAGLVGIWSLVESPDGKNLYGTRYADNALVVFARDTTNGTLSFVETLFDNKDGVDGLAGAYDIAVSNDGKNIYVTGFRDDAVGVFSRGEDGTLKFMEAEREGVDFVSGLDGTYGVMVSPDDKNVFVTNYFDDSIVVFNRTADGLLEFASKIKNEKEVKAGLNGPFGMAMDSEGKKLFVTGNIEGTLLVFDRGADGNLTLNTIIKNDDKQAKGLEQAREIIISPDNKYLFISANDRLLIFTLSDNLIPSYATSIQNIEDTNGLNKAWGLDISQDGKRIYITGYNDNTVLEIKRLD